LRALRRARSRPVTSTFARFIRQDRALAAQIVKEAGL
jgi:hypothetical protein